MHAHALVNTKKRAVLSYNTSRVCSAQLKVQKDIHHAEDGGTSVERLLLISKMDCTGGECQGKD